MWRGVSWVSPEATRKAGEGRWRPGRRRRAQAARWHSTEQLGCAGWKTTGGGGAGPAGPSPWATDSLFLFFYLSV